MMGQEHQQGEPSLQAASSGGAVRAMAASPEDPHAEHALYSMTVGSTPGVHAAMATAQLHGKYIF